MHSPRPPSPTSPAPPSAALPAFLRGIERRAFVLAYQQCGSPMVAGQALGRSMRAFRAVSGQTPLSSWPAAFWSLLLAQPELSQGDSASPALAALSSGPRAALLLRLVAGLDFSHAAQVLGVDEATYRYASQRALQQLGQAGVSYTDLAALREDLHRQVKALPEAQVTALAAQRERILADQPEPVAALPAPARWPRQLLWAALAALLLALLLSLLWPSPGLAPGASEPLPPAAPAPAPVAELSDTDLVTHPDYALLAAPGDEALAKDLALLSWLAASPAAWRPADTAPAAPGPAEAAEPETILGTEAAPDGP